MRRITKLFLLLLVAGSLPAEIQGTETNSEILLDSQGHRFDDARYDAIRKLYNQENEASRNTGQVNIKRPIVCWQNPLVKD